MTMVTASAWGAVEDHPGAVRRIGYVGRRQVDHEQPVVSIDGDMTLATDDLLARL